MAAAPAVFRVEGVSKYFGGFRALHDVSLQVGKGEVLAIIGPNGAGKTTLVHVVSGLLKPSRGRIFLAGEDITTLPAHRRAQRGLARTFQITSLFDGLTIAEHVALAHRGPHRHARSDGAVPDVVSALLHEVGLNRLAECPVETLSHGDQRILEVAMALAARPRLILLDEPTAGMSVSETAAMIGLINRHLRGEISVIIIEHDMAVVTQSADRITVLAAGSVVAEGPPQQVLPDPRVREVYFGSATSP